MQNLQRELGLIAVGEAGRRAATAAGLRTSANTLLRRVINAPETKSPGPHVGIDEWAWHRGLRYGTLIANLDTLSPLILLPGRDQRTLAAWFRKYQENFYRLLKTKNKTWFTSVSENGPVELQRVAAGMEADAAAICEAITSSWSKGVVEGHVNHLKMLKRQMYGRAGFGLLKRRVMSPLA